MRSASSGCVQCFDPCSTVKMRQPSGRCVYQFRWSMEARASRTCFRWVYGCAGTPVERTAARFLDRPPKGRGQDSVGIAAVDLIEPAGNLRWFYLEGRGSNR
jgi:hypothetical protein